MKVQVFFPFKNGLETKCKKNPRNEKPKRREKNSKITYDYRFESFQCSKFEGEKVTCVGVDIFINRGNTRIKPRKYLRKNKNNKNKNEKRKGTTTQIVVRNEVPIPKCLTKKK